MVLPDSPLPPVPAKPWGFPLKDFYYKRLYKDVDRYGAALYRTHLSLFGPDSNLQIAQKDYEEVERVYDEFERSKRLWQQACKDKEPAQARKLAKGMRKQLEKIDDVTTTSQTNAAKNQHYEHRYKAVESRAIHGHTFTQYRSSSELRIPPCLFHFRRHTTDRLVKWLAALKNGKNDDPLSTRRVHLLVGGKGCGKTVLMHSIAKLFKSENALGASFVFTERLTVIDMEERFVATMVDQLGRYLESFKEKVSGLSLDDKTFVDTTIRHQTSKILVAAASRLAQDEKKKIFMLFDGLDDSNPDILEYIFEFMHESLKHLPNIYFITATRHSSYVQSALIRSGLKEESTQAPYSHVEVTEIEDFGSQYEMYRQASPHLFP